MDLEQKRELFKRLLAEHGDRVYAFAFSLAGNETDASDLVAEGFAKALKSFDQYDETKAFHSWIFKIVQNVYVDWTRLQAKTSSLDGWSEEEEDTSPADRLTAEEPGPESGPAKDETRAMVRRAIKALPEEYRAPLALCDMSGMTYDEIAEALDCPVGTVRSRIFRGRKLLRERLEAYVKDGKGGMS